MSKSTIVGLLSVMARVIGVLSSLVTTWLLIQNTSVNIFALIVYIGSIGIILALSDMGIVNSVNNAFNSESLLPRKQIFIFSYFFLIFQTFILTFLIYALSSILSLQGIFGDASDIKIEKKILLSGLLSCLLYNFYLLTYRIFQALHRASLAAVFSIISSLLTLLYFIYFLFQKKQSTFALVFGTFGVPGIIGLSASSLMVISILIKKEFDFRNILQFPVYRKILSNSRLFFFVNIAMTLASQLINVLSGHILSLTEFASFALYSKIYILFSSLFSAFYSQAWPETARDLAQKNSLGIFERRKKGEKIGIAICFFILIFSIFGSDYVINTWSSGNVNSSVYFKGGFAVIAGIQCLLVPVNLILLGMANSKPIFLSYTIYVICTLLLPIIFCKFISAELGVVLSIIFANIILLIVSRVTINHALMRM